ncbi:MAG: hypothetical protein ACRD8W_17110 [Nitrososphaeraceae archaeon]
MGDEERKKMIIDYISSHHGCTREEIDKHKDDVPISRVKIFSLVNELVKEGSVEKVQERVNSRSHRLYVDSSNLLITVPRELDEFESNYMNLIEESLQKIIIRNDDPDTTEYVPGVLYALFEIFFVMVDCYLAKVVLVWPNTVSDKETLEKLLRLVFGRITKLQITLYEFKTNYHYSSPHPSIPSRDLAEVILDETIDQRLGNLRKLIADNLSTFFSTGLIKEFDSIIDSLWKISADFHLPKDWRNLLDLDWVLKKTIFIPDQYEEYNMKDFFSVYPYFSINTEKRNEEARIHLIRKYGSLPIDKKSNALNSEQNLPSTEPESISHTSNKNNELASKMTEQPEISCIFCQHTDRSEFDLGIHCAEDHELELMRLPIDGTTDKRIDFAVMRGKIRNNIKSVLP